MARGLGGLASGLLAGADLGMRMRKQEREEARDTELSRLRQSQEERAEAAETRAQETHEQALERGEQQMTLAEMAGKRAERQEKRAERTEERAKSAEKRAKEWQDWQISNAKYQRQVKDAASMAPIEYERVAGGGDFSPEFLEKAKGTRFDPSYMMKPEYREAAKKVYDFTGQLVRGETRDIANPEIIDSVNVLLAPDIKRGIGEVDPNTGKKITDKRLVDITPYQNRGYVFEVETTLDDGSTYTAPITEHRSTNKDDPVKIITPEQLINQVNGHMAMASAYNQPDLYNAVDRSIKKTGVASQETTKRQHLRALDNVDKWETDQVSKLDPDMMTEDEFAAKKSAIEKQASDRRAKIDKRYGMTRTEVGKGSGKVPTPEGGGEPRTDLTQWAGEDTQKQSFLAEAQAYADQSGEENPFNAYTPDELNNIYRQWAADKEADNLVASM